MRLFFLDERDIDEVARAVEHVTDEEVDALRASMGSFFPPVVTPANAHELELLSARAAAMVIVHTLVVAPEAPYLLPAALGAMQLQLALATPAGEITPELVMAPRQNLRLVVPVAVMVDMVEQADRELDANPAPEAEHTLSKRLAALC